MLEAIEYYLMSILTINKFKAGWTILVGLLTAGIGGFDEIVAATFSLAILDYILGFSWGWSNKKIDWTKLKKGIWKFPLYYGAIYAGMKIDEMLPGFLTGYGPAHNFITVYLGVIEFLSVAKWLMRFDVKLPAKLLARLEDYRDEMNLCRRETDKLDEKCNPTIDDKTGPEEVTI